MKKNFAPIIYCPICNSKGNFSFTSKKKKIIYNCQNISCDHFWTPISKENQGMHPRDYDIKKFSDKNLKFFRKRNIKILDLFLKNIPKSKTYNFIDFGTGSGHIARSFKEKLRGRLNLFCVEPNQKCTSLYQDWGLIHIKDISELHGKYDLIYMIEVIEHIDDLYSVLKHVKRLLKPEGKFFITTPPGCDDENITTAFNNFTHVHFFTPNSLNLLLNKSGFKEIEFKILDEMLIVPSNRRKIYNFFINLKEIFRIKRGDNFKTNNKISKNENFKYKKYNKNDLNYPYHLMGLTSHSK